MRLSDLIQERKEEILQEFEDFARTHTRPGNTMDVEALRNDASEMLDTIALDLEQPQTPAEQKRKGKGDAPTAPDSPRTAAEDHGQGRAQRGFSMEETFAEYRALRASVMRFYVATLSDRGDADVQDVIRFNESIDQALAESITEFSGALNHYRDMSLAVLGHDLRSPLSAVMNAATVLSEHSDLTGRDRRLAGTIVHTATTMGRLVDDLLEYTADELGDGLVMNCAPADLVEIASDVVREFEVSRPDSDILLETDGEARGEWDTDRIRQALSNLLANAIRHAEPDSRIRVRVSAGGGGDEVVASVHNHGEPIPEEEQNVIFHPFRGARPTPVDQPRRRGHLGLGLYITRRMCEAHGGSIELDSSEESGTTFYMRLPRTPAGEVPGN